VEDGLAELLDGVQVTLTLEGGDHPPHPLDLLLTHAALGDIQRGAGKMRRAAFAHRGRRIAVAPGQRALQRHGAHQAGYPQFLSEAGVELAADAIQEELAPGA